MRDADIAYDASTDYGQTFREFKTDYMDILNKKTTLIIIGDGRSNYTNPETGILCEMRGTGQNGTETRFNRFF